MLFFSSFVDQSIICVRIITSQEHLSLGKVERQEPFLLLDLLGHILFSDLLLNQKMLLAKGFLSVGGAGDINMTFFLSFFSKHVVSEIGLSVTPYHLYLFIFKIMCMDHTNICIIKHIQRQILKGCANRYQQRFNRFHPAFQKIACIPPGVYTLHFEECFSHCSLAEPSFS